MTSESHMIRAPWTSAHLPSFTRPRGPTSNMVPRYVEAPGPISTARGNRLRNQRASFNERACADMDAFEDRCVRANPDIVLNGYRPFRNLRPRTALAERRTGDGVGDALGRLEQMKIRVGNRRVPANDDVIADAHFQITKQDRVGEIPIVP